MKGEGDEHVYGGGSPRNLALEIVCRAGMGWPWVAVKDMEENFGVRLTQQIDVVDKALKAHKFKTRLQQRGKTTLPHAKVELRKALEKLFIVISFIQVSENHRDLLQL